MSWSVETTEDGPEGDGGEGHVTTHTHPKRRGHELSVEHNPSPLYTPATHSVTISYGKGFAPRRGTLAWPSAEHGKEKAYLHAEHTGPKYVAPPSERLRALIEAHGEDHAWMPLLDAVAEEYPDLEPAVAAHTAARA